MRLHRRTAIAALVIGLAAAAVVFAPSADALVAAARQPVAWIERNPTLGAGLFLAFATLGKVTPIPGGVIVMLTAGYLFGSTVGPALAALGSALAAVGVTAVGRWVFPDAVARLKGSRFARYEEALARDGVLYLAAIRVLPLVPAWVGNLLPVAVDIPLRWVFLATLIGVAPLSMVLGGIGSRLQDLSETARLDVAVLLSPETLLPLVGLIGLALLPIAAHRWWTGRRR